MNWLLTSHWLLIASIWYFANGVLHDIFVIQRHKGKYDRELLRLLMDGHVLLLSGAVSFICYLMILHNVLFAAWISLVIAVGMLIYCAMIFPFLKSIVTMIISTILF